MINTKILLERFLQKQRFKRIPEKYLKGEVLDFGGNEGELRPYVQGNYTLVNYDHSPMLGKKFNSIIALAVIEHISFDEVFSIFTKFSSHLLEDGCIIITTPTPPSKPILELLADLSLLDKENILEHKHYWTKNELYALAEASNLEVTQYYTFQLGFNQYCTFRKKGIRQTDVSDDRFFQHNMKRV